MHPKFLPLLCCPESRRPLRLESAETRADGCVMTGRLVTEDGRAYPVVRGIPRFVESERYSASFGYEWTRWPRVQFDAENAGGPMHDASRTSWERITMRDDAELAGRTVVEFGCGPGRYLDVVRRKGGLAVGLDLSIAVEAARRNFADDPDVLIVQGDVLNPPFRDGACDGGYSIGVFHHTPDPARAVAALARVIRPGGWIAVAVYRRGGFYDLPSVHRTRRFQNRISRFAGHAFARCYARLSARVFYPGHVLLHRLRLGGLAEFIYRHVLVIVEFPDARWRELDVFDAITPAMASVHDPDEVRDWLQRAGCADIEASAWNATALHGRIPERT